MFISLYYILKKSATIKSTSDPDHEYLSDAIARRKKITKSNTHFFFLSTLATTNKVIQLLIKKKNSSSKIASFDKDQLVRGVGGGDRKQLI